MTTKLDQALGGHDKDTFIQVWRGIACLLVIYGHFTDRVPFALMGSNHQSILPFYSGKIGVLVFFVISGFLITKSLADSTNVASFYAKRISRIWPLFILSAIVIFIFLQFVPPPVVDYGPRPFYTEKRTIIDLIGTIFFLEDLGFHWIDGVYWSILVELKFYMWIGLFAWAFPKNFVRNFAICSVIIATLEIMAHLIHTPLALGGARILNGFFVAQYLPFFSVGALLLTGKHRDLLTLNLLVAVLQSGIKIAANPNFEFIGTVHFLLVLIALLAVDALFFKHYLFVKFGDYAYAWYLFHQMIGLSLIREITPTIGIDWAIALALVLTFFLGVLGAWLLEWRLRRPCYQFLYAVFSRLRLDRLALVAKSAPPPATPATGAAAPGG